MSSQRGSGRTEPGCRLQVRVQPGAKRDELVGWQGDVLRVRVRAAAVEGAANRGLLEFLAQRLGLRRSQLSLLRGEHHRDKVLDVEGVTAEELRSRLDGTLSQGA